jgi:hypothetical protein
MTDILRVDLDRLQSTWWKFLHSFRRIGQETPLERLPLKHIQRRFRDYRFSLGKPVRVISEEHLWQGRGMQALAFIIALISLAVLSGALIVLRPYILLIIDCIIAIVFGFFGLAAAVYLLNRARPLLYPTADELLTVDKRQPILFLRSFDDDVKTFNEEEKRNFISLLQSSLVTLGKLVTTLRELFAKAIKKESGLSGVPAKSIPFEFVIHKELRQIGPVIAVGRPGEKLPPLGAARSHFDDDEWKDAVLAWMEHARMIVVVAGGTKGVTWELDQIASRGYKNKTLFLFPPKPMKLAWPTSFWGMLNQIWKHFERQNEKKERWVVIRDKFLSEDNRRALGREAIDRVMALHFSRDGSPVLVRGREHTPAKYRLALMTAAYGMLCHRTESVDQSSDKSVPGPPIKTDKPRV